MSSRRGDKNLLSTIERDRGNMKEKFKDKRLMFFQQSCNRKNAEQLLGKNTKKALQEGLFLVRPNHTDPNGFVLSAVLHGTISHLKIANCGSLKYTIEVDGTVKTEEAYDGLDGLITQCTEDPKSLLSAKLKKSVKGSLPPPLALHTGFTNIIHRNIEKRDEKHKQKVKDILRLLQDNTKEIDINMRNEEGFTALHLAAKLGVEDLVEALLKMPDIEKSPIDFEGLTPLHHACRRDFAGVADILMKNEAKVMFRCEVSGNYPIHDAAMNGSLNCIKTLLAHGASAWPRNEKDVTPYELAKEVHEECASYLDSYVPKPPPTKKEDWYHGKISRQEVEKIFDNHGKKNGLFLVRDSSQKANVYVLTFCYKDRLRIYEIKNKKGYYCIDRGPFFHSLELVIYYYSQHADGIDYRLIQSISPKGSYVRMHSQIHSEDDDLYLKNFASATVLPSGETQYEIVMDDNKDPVYYRSGSSSRGVLERHFKGHIINKSQLSLEYELGQGEFGSVMKGEWTHDGVKTSVAVKTMREEFVESGRQSFLGEAEVMVKLNHPCIVSFLGVCEGPPLMIVQELIALGSLLDFLLDYPEKISPSKDLPLWAAQIASAMLYFEDQRFVHRDLAARNILLASESQAKVGDFGLSRTIATNNEIYQASKGGRWPIRWYAPESVNYGNFSHASDVWSFGVTLWEMFTFGDQPYGEMSGQEVVDHVDKGGRLEKPDNCPTNVYNMMLACWKKNASDRCTFKMLLNFFNDESKRYGRRESILPH